MKVKSNWIRIFFYVGFIAILVGMFDPMEGSVIIAVGSIITTLSIFLMRTRHRKYYLVSSVMIVIGVFFLFYFSSLGGFGGKSTLSWWWSILILPYPIGWLTTMILLSYFYTQDRHRRIYLASLIMVVIGLFFLIFLASINGIVGKSTLFRWWDILILPYPIGLLTIIILLIFRAFDKRKLIGDTNL